MIPQFAHIYGLFDPRCPNVIWYVGKTNNPHNRLQYYRKDASTTPVYRWFRRLQNEGFEPKLRVLETCPFAEWKDRERVTIALHRKKNLLLLNKFAGGNGTGVKGCKEFCDTCGGKRVRLFPSDSSLRCPVCRKEERDKYYKGYYAKHKEAQKLAHAEHYVANTRRVLAANLANKLKQIEAGLCAWTGCADAPDSDKKQCRFHLDTQARRSRAFRQNKKKVQVANKVSDSNINSDNSGNQVKFRNPASHPLPTSAGQAVTASTKSAGQPNAVVHGQVNSTGTVRGPVFDNPA